MKKTILIWLFVVICFVNAVHATSLVVDNPVIAIKPSASGKLEIYVYYNSSLFCPKERPIRKVTIPGLDLYNCIASGDITPIHYKYLKNGNQIICQIPENAHDAEVLRKYLTQEENINLWKMKLDKDRMEFLRVLYNNNIEFAVPVDKNVFCDGLTETDLYDEEIYIPGQKSVISSFPPHDGLCTKEEMDFVKKDNEKIIAHNAEIEEELAENYGKDCFSCEDDEEFWTDEKTCSLCPNREMVGSFCVLKNTDNKGSLF